MRKRNYAYRIQRGLPFLELGGGLVQNFLNSPQYSAIDTSNVNLGNSTTGLKKSNNAGTVAGVAGVASGILNTLAQGNQNYSHYDYLPGVSATQSTVDSLASMIPVVGQIYGAGKSIDNYAKTDYAAQNEFGELVNTNKFIIADTIGTFLDPLESFISGVSGEGWTPQQRADKINAKGYNNRRIFEQRKAAEYKQNEINAGYGGKYFDTNNLMQAEFGGELDASNERQWLSNWYNHPATKARMGADSTKVAEITNRLNTVPVKTGLRFGSAGYYDPRKKEIYSVSGDPELVSHELVHSTEYIPSNFPDISDKSVYLSDKEISKNRKGRGYANYISDKGEQYARLMNLRKRLNKNPGDIITEGELMKLKNYGEYNDLKSLFKDYKGLAKVLNEIAYSGENNRAMAFGGDLPIEPKKESYGKMRERQMLAESMKSREPWNTAYPVETETLDKGIVNDILEYKRQAALPRGDVGIGTIAPLTGVMPTGPACLGSGCVKSAQMKQDSQGSTNAGYRITGVKKEFGGGLPQITEYTTGGQHSENPNGGIPVDAQGNMASVSGRNPVATTEEGEITWMNPSTKQSYVFSNKIFI